MPATGFLEVLDRVAPTWPRRATANEAAWLVRVREERDTYRIETAWSGRHLLKRSAVSAVCAFLVDLVYAGLDGSGLVCLHCAAVEIGGGIIVFPDTYRAGHYAMAAAQEALDQAGWHPESTEDRMRTATAIGTGVGGVPAITDAAETIRTAGVRRLSPFVVPSFLPNLAAGQIAIRFGFHGPAGAPVTA